jgi:hypothetical protein
MANPSTVEPHLPAVTVVRLRLSSNKMDGTRALLREFD